MSTEQKTDAPAAQPHSKRGNAVDVGCQCRRVASEAEIAVPKVVHKQHNNVGSRAAAAIVAGGTVVTSGVRVRAASPHILVGERKEHDSADHRDNNIHPAILWRPHVERLTCAKSTKQIRAARSHYVPSKHTANVVRRTAARPMYVCVRWCVRGAWCVVRGVATWCVVIVASPALMRGRWPTLNPCNNIKQSKLRHVTKGEYNTTTNSVTHVSAKSAILANEFKHTYNVPVCTHMT